MVLNKWSTTFKTKKKEKEVKNRSHLFGWHYKRTFINTHVYKSKENPLIGPHTNDSEYPLYAIWHILWLFDKGFTNMVERKDVR